MWWRKVGGAEVRVATFLCISGVGCRLAAVSCVYQSPISRHDPLLLARNTGSCGKYFTVMRPATASQDGMFSSCSVAATFSISHTNWLGPFGWGLASA